MANTLGSVVIEMAVNLARLRSDFGQAAQISQTRLREIQRSAEITVRQISNVGRSVQAAFGTLGIGVGVTSLIYSLKSAAAAAIDYGDEIAKAQAKTGVAGAAFSELAYAARQNDVSLEALGTAFKKLQVTISEAGSGSKTALATFRALGLQFEDLRNLSPDQQFEQIAEQISRLKDPADRTRAAVELFGRAGADLLPLFEEGAKGIRILREEAVRTGRSLTDDQIKALSSADQAIKDLTASWESFSRTLTASVAPSITKILERLETLQNVKAPDVFRTLLAEGPLASYGDLAKTVQQRMAREAVQGALAPGLNADLMRRSLQASPQAAPPGFKPEDKTGKVDAMAGLFVPAVYERPIFNFANEQAKAFEQFSQESARNVQKNLQDLSNDTTKMLGEMTVEWQKSTSEWTAFAEQAAANVTDAFARFLFDPFKEGLRGMLASFVDTIRQMLAQYLALQAITGLGSALAGSSNKFVSGIGTFLKGAKASGGPVSPGAWLVGESGPEVMVTRSSGTVIPNSAMGGGNISLSYQIDARGADAERIMAMLPGLLKRTKDETVATLIDMQRRGRFA